MFLNKEMCFMKNVINIILINFFDFNCMRMKIMQPGTEYVNLFFINFPKIRASLVHKRKIKTNKKQNFLPMNYEIRYYIDTFTNSIEEIFTLGLLGFNHISFFFSGWYSDGICQDVTRKTQGC